MLHRRWRIPPSRRRATETLRWKLRTAFPSLPAPVKVAEELLEFVRHREAVQHGKAVTVQSELRRKRHRHPVRSIPVNSRAQVLRGQVQSEAVAVAQAAIHFDASLKLLRTKSA